MTPIHRTVRNFSRPGTFILAALVLALGVPLTHAKDDDKPGKRVDRMVSHMEKELDLSQDQSAKIRAILTKNAEAMPHRGDWKKKDKGCAGCDRCGEGPHGKGGAFGLMGGEEFAAQLRSGSVDTAALNRAHAQRADSAQARLRAHHARRVATFAEIHAVLTPEQRTKAADKMEKRLAAMKKKCKKKCGESCK